ncbi:MAG: ABC transporter substrate-binding protein, partial [Acidimicrobiales bacterium]
GVASVTNPLGGSYATAFEGVEAYFDMVNSEGGLYGRELVLAAKRDDALANNKSQVEALLSVDKVLAVLPVASLLFTAADVLVQKNVPTFGWTINLEWQGSPDNPKANLFGQSGSFLCFECYGHAPPWLAQEIGAKRIGVVAYSIPQSSLCADGLNASFEKYGEAVDARIAFVDQSVPLLNPDYSVQVSKMKQAGVDLVTACIDTNGVVSLAKEMKKQELDAVQLLVNGYDHDFLSEFGDLFEGSYVRTDFVQWEVEDKPEGLQKFLDWMDKAGKEPTENSIVGWLNADLFVTGLREAGPNFDRQKLIDAINSITDYTADGILHAVDWTKAHTERQSDTEGCQFLSKVEDSEFVPVFSKPGKPFVCAVDQGDKLVARYDP